MREPFDVVHISLSSFPADPRPRREALAARAVAPRVGILALRDDPSLPAVGHYKGIAIIRLAGSKRRGSIATYLHEYLGFTLRAWVLVRRDRRLRQAKVVHVHSLPDFLVAAARPARKRGARVILDLHEIFPEFARAKFQGVLGRIMEFLAKRAERWSRRQADVLITVNRPVAKLLQSRPARKKEEVMVLHNSPDSTDFGPLLVAQTSRHTPLRLVYHGTLTPIYGLDLAVRAVAAARREGHSVTYDIYGSGPQRSVLEDLISQEGATEFVRLPGVVPHYLLTSTLRSYDVGFVPTRLNVMTQYSLSTKLLEYVHLGLPVIAPRIPAYEHYFPETLWYYPPDDSQAASQAVVSFLRASPKDISTRVTATQAQLKQMEWAREREALAGIYRRLLKAMAS